MPALGLLGRRWPTVLPGQGDIFDLPNLDRTTVAGISVAIAGNVLISLALNCQKLAHRRLELHREGIQDLNDQKPQAKPTNVPNTLGITVEEQDEAEETTPTADNIRLGERGDATPSTVTPTEIEPLLNRHPAARSYGSGASEPAVTSASKPPWLSRFSPWKKRVRRAIDEAEDAHLQAVHSLVPVDVVTVRSKSTERQDSRRSQISLEHGNESAYLKSKLWYAYNRASPLYCHLVYRLSRWLGFALMNIGEIGNFISYGFAPASVVAPLGTVSASNVHFCNLRVTVHYIISLLL